MQKPEKILKEMECLLDNLIESARKLLILSTQVIEEEELSSLQQEQEKLLASLIEKDCEFHKVANGAESKLMPQRLKIDKKIDDFQKLNAEFVENINTTHGLIQFDKGRIKKRD